MEYVDGEDLASLLRRIGRLPETKALEVARQLCAGLAAAHERGVLHRDLKPANVMIDGQGKVRITDFGLAVLAPTGTVQDVRAGTPAYMAPEQLGSGRASVQSDLYSLGVLLYETFTGRPPFAADNVLEMRRLHAESAPASPSTILQDLDPVVEHAILRCLEKDPRERPVSALAVSASLPGGDPLRAALAAGEIPSPEMVAAAGDVGGLSRRMAWGALGLALGLLVAVAALSGRLSMLDRIPFEKSRPVLQDRAVEILRAAGHTAAPADHASGFVYHSDYLRWVRSRDASPRRWDGLGSGRPHAVGFWYRQSPRYMSKWSFIDGPSLTPTDPPPLVSGMAHVLLDPAGRLVELQVLTPQVDSTAAAAPPEVDWSPLFAAAGLDPAQFAPAPPHWLPLMHCDTRRAWTGMLPELAAGPLRVEAGSWNGRPQWFQVIGPWSRPSRLQAHPRRTGERVTQALSTGIIAVMLLGGVLLARRNLRLHRGDRRGAGRLALYILAVFAAGWSLQANHAADIAEEWNLFVPSVGIALFVSALLWIVYLALEPYVRKRWPSSLISWSRLLAGRFRDPMLGRDLLLGVVAGALMSACDWAGSMLPALLGLPDRQPALADLGVLRGARFALSELVLLQTNAIFTPMAMLFLLMLFRLVLRVGWIAVLVLILLLTALASMTGDSPAADAIPSLVFSVVWVAILLRFGLFAAMVAIFTVNTLAVFPLTLDFSRWFAPYGLLALVALGGLAAYGFHAARGGRALRPFVSR
jgi:serine/threonine-protein kinase